MKIIYLLPLHFVRESKTVLDSGFHNLDSWFQVLDSSLCQWNMDFWISIVSGIPGFLGCIDYSVLQIPGFLWIPQAKLSWTLQANISQISLHGAIHWVFVNCGTSEITFLWWIYGSELAACDSHTCHAQFSFKTRDVSLIENDPIRGGVDEHFPESFTDPQSQT